MGVVRDVTVDNLVTAVGNIDTSSLAQDSTLQDVATAINNISGGSDPVTNTTVNTLGKDTTLQSIAAAISGLGTSLGSDKANISGDNIASPSTFRTNIGINATNTPFDNTDTEAGNNVQEALKGLWDKIVRCNNNAQFPNLLANEQERWLIGMTRLSIADGCFVIACKYNNVVSVTEIFKSSSFAYTTNAQGTIAFTYGGSATGVRGGAIRIY